MYFLLKMYDIQYIFSTESSYNLLSPLSQSSVAFISMSVYYAL